MNQQQLLPFKELENHEPLAESADSVISFHLPKTLKDDLIKIIKQKNLSISGILNGLISDYLDALKTVLKPKKTGRGHVDTESIEKVKEYMRIKFPSGVRIVDVAKYIGCTQARAARLLDLLSGGTDGREYNFLVWEDDEVTPHLFYINKDNEKR